ncbi:MAG: hypothetical protein AAGF27_00475 [Pseudomonadota bacterium]
MKKILLAATFWFVALAPQSEAATLDPGITAGITEGNPRHRPTVVGTTHTGGDSRRAEGVFDIGLLRPGDVFGLYGRIVGASDYFAFSLVVGSYFEVALDLDGYDVYGNAESVNHVPISGLVSQTRLHDAQQAERPKTVTFRLKETGGPSQVIELSTDIYGPDAASVLFKGSISQPTTYIFEIDGQNRTAALYDVRISVSQVPLPAGLVLFVSALTTMAAVARKPRARLCNG